MSSTFHDDLNFDIASGLRRRAGWLRDQRYMHPNNPACDGRYDDAIEAEMERIEADPEVMRELCIRAVECNDAGEEILQALYRGEAAAPALVEAWQDDLRHYVRELAVDRVNDQEAA